MLDEKKRKETITLIKRLLDDGKIIKPKKYTKKFFMNKARNALDTSQRLMLISTDEKDELKNYLWIITTSYYAMFFAAISLLAHLNHKIDSSIGIHRLTYHALLYYCVIDDNKLQKHYIEQYKEAYDDAEQLLQISESKVFEMLNNLKYEQDKRHSFTYEEGLEAEKSKAKISLERAKSFVSEVRKIIT